jgi:5-dehydro-2-deoxygluconokinase
MIEIIAGKRMAGLDDTTVAQALEELYAQGIKPDWWKLEPQATGEAWRAIGAAITRHDPYCRGIVLLGLEAPEAELERAFAVAAGHEMVKGFAVGRTLFNEAAEAWLAGKMDDEAAIDDMAGRFASLVKSWQCAQERRAA